MHMQSLKEQDWKSLKSTFSQPLSIHLSGVGVISTGPGGSSTVLVVRVDDTNNGSVGAANQQKGTGHDDEHAPRYHDLPPQVAVAAVPVVVQPHAAHGLEAHECTEQSTDEGHQTAEDGDRRGNDVGGERHGSGKTEPDDPVLGGVVVKVVGAAQSADEEVLGGDLARC